MVATVPVASWDVWGGAADDGYSPTIVADLLADCEAMGTGALLVVSHGRVLAEFGETTRRWIVQSARKSLLSVLFGVLWDRGLVDLGASLADLGIDDKTPLSASERTATIEQLLQSRSGVFLPAAAEYQSVAAGRPPRGSHRPGTHYWYNNWDFNAAGAIFQQLSGLTVYEAFRDWLATPMGMQDYRVEDGRDFLAPTSDHAAYHFVMSARDLARFGLLVARHGRWGDSQLVSDAWMQRSTTRHTPDAGGGFGYGYMWWIGDPSVADGHEWIAARGGAGHVLWVVPALDLVIAHRNAGMLDTPTWDDVAPVLTRVIDARHDATDASVTAFPTSRPRDRGRALGDGWVRYERDDLGVAFDVPADWRTSDAVGFGERLRATAEDGWARRTVFTRREPWRLDQADALVARHLERLAKIGARDVRQSAAVLDKRPATRLDWTASGPAGARRRWYIATDGNERFDLSFDESGPANPAVLDRVAESCRFYEPPSPTRNERCAPPPWSIRSKACRSTSTHRSHRTTSSSRRRARSPDKTSNESSLSNSSVSRAATSARGREQSTKRRAPCSS